MRIPELFAVPAYGPDGLVGDVLLDNASFADYDESLHPRGQGGKWARKAARQARREAKRSRAFAESEVRARGEAQQSRSRVEAYPVLHAGAAVLGRVYEAAAGLHSADDVKRVLDPKAAERSARGETDRIVKKQKAALDEAVTDAFGKKAAKALRWLDNDFKKFARDVPSAVKDAVARARDLLGTDKSERRKRVLEALREGLDDLSSDAYLAQAFEDAFDGGDVEDYTRTIADSLAEEDWPAPPSEDEAKEKALDAERLDAAKLIYGHIRKAFLSQTVSSATFSREPDPPADDAAALARHYAELYSALEDAGLPVPPGEADTANEELRGTGWRVGRVAGGWRAVQDAGDASFAGYDESLHPRAEHGRFASKGGTKAKLADGREVEFIPHPAQSQWETMVMVDPRKLDAAWPASDRIDEQGRGPTAIKGRREQVTAFVATGAPIHAVQAMIDIDGSLRVNDGRHRLSTLRDLGASAVGVTVPREDVKEMIRRFGTDEDQAALEAEDAERRAAEDARLAPPPPRPSALRRAFRSVYAALGGDASFAAERAPVGGVTIGGKDYRGGQFIPAAVVAKATPEEKAALDRGKEPAEAKAAARRARGPLDVTALRGRLVPHAAPLSREETRSAASSWRMLLRHHGGLALHRVEELATLSENALAGIVEDHPNAEGLRTYFGRQLAKYHGMLDMAHADGVTGKVEAPPAEAGRVVLPDRPSQIDIHKGWQQAQGMGQEAAADFLDQVERKKGAMALRELATDHGVSLQVNPGGKGTDLASTVELRRRILDTLTPTAPSTAQTATPPTSSPGSRNAAPASPTHRVTAAAMANEVSEYAKLGISPGEANSGDCATAAREAVKTIRAAGSEATFGTPQDSLAHVWVISGGRHYDLQHPGGVDDPAELTFFQDNPDLLEGGWKETATDPLTPKLSTLFSRAVEALRAAGATDAVVEMTIPSLREKEAEFAALWDESKHRRGQPKNRGQFATGGGGQFGQLMAARKARMAGQGAAPAATPSAPAAATPAHQAAPASPVLTADETHKVNTVAGNVARYLAAQGATREQVHAAVGVARQRATAEVVRRRSQSPRGLPTAAPPSAPGKAPPPPPPSTPEAGEGTAAIPRPGLNPRRSETEQMHREKLTAPLSAEAGRLLEKYRGHLDAHPGINEHTKMEYSRNLSAVFNQLPPAAVKHLEGGLQAVHFHGDVDGVTEAARRAGAPAEGRAAGVYDGADGSVNVDGAGTHSLGFGTLAHEITHAIDGPDAKHSNSPEWRTAWNEEIRAPKDGLTDYARTASEEGFAEFGRAMYTMPAATVAKVKAQFPRCYAYGKERGLWH